MREEQRLRFLRAIETSSGRPNRSNGPISIQHSKV